MINNIKRNDLQRIGIFLLIAYGGAILTALTIHFTGGLAQSPYTFILLPTAYMWSPALANIFTRLLTAENWKHTWINPQFKQGWKFWLAAWFLPGILIMLGSALYFLIFPASFDPGMSTLRQGFALAGKEPPMPMAALAAIQIAAGMLVAPIINSLFTFGEEFGWRAYLLQKLLPLGYRKALIILGVIWGTWHWPIIALGYNYGLNYPGAPWPGMLLFIWVCFCFGTVLSWLTLKSGSVWPAVIGHAAINGMASVAILFLNGTGNSLLGPTVQGAIGVAGFAVVAIILFARPGSLPEISTESN